MEIRQADIKNRVDKAYGSLQKRPEERFSEKVSFGEILKSKGSFGVKFSGHALRRIEARALKFDNDELVRISNAIDKAEKKGVKDAVILMDNKILISNVASRTIVTTFSQEQVKDNVFTNIDGAVIA